MLSNILVAFDGSRHSINAAKFAAKVVEAIPGSRCTLITVLTFTKDQATFLGANAEDFEKAEKYFEGSSLENIKKHCWGLWYSTLYWLPHSAKILV